MTNLPHDLVPQGTPPIEYEDAIFAVYTRIALGDTVKGAVENVGAFKRSTLYKWRADFPEWMGEIEASAREAITSIRREHEISLTGLALEAELSVRRKMMLKAQDVVDRLLDVATDEDSANKDVIAAARAIRVFLTEGFVYPRTEGRPEELDEEQELAFNPHLETLEHAVIELPPGSTVSISTPDLPLEVMPSKPD
jgi:hypothetical protein